MQLVDFRRQLHYRGVFIIFLIWRLFVDSTQKAVKNQEICEPLQGNLGITQSSGLDRLFMNNTQKVLKNQHICEQATPNLGITQSSGLDHLSGYPDK